MSTTRISPEQNKALVLTAFDALFNKQDYQRQLEADLCRAFNSRNECL
jgi:hypothetical protein